MRTAPRRYLSRASLVLLFTVDLLALVALVMDQLLAAGAVATWLLAAVLTAALMPVLLRLVEHVFAAARAASDVRIPGETFP